MKKLLVFAILAILLGACSSPVTVEMTPTAEPTVTLVPTIVPTKTIVPTVTIVPSATDVPCLEAEARDFDIALIVLEKQCFGSAGCLVTVIPEVAFSGIRYPYDCVEMLPGKTYTLIYEIYGGEDGTLTFNLTIEDGGYAAKETMISTAHKDDELTVKAVRLLGN